MAYQSINPNDGKLLKSFGHLSPAQLEKAAALLHAQCRAPLLRPALLCLAVA